MTIPKIIHQVWVPPGDKIPDHLLDAAESWFRRHPGWKYRLWTNHELRWLQNQYYFDAAPDLVPEDAVGQLRADIARYEILARQGGLYVDMDTVAMKPIDDLLEDQHEFAAAEDVNWVGNTYLACRPGHPVMRMLVDGLPASLDRSNGRMRPNKLSGPQYLTPLWLQHGCYVAPQRLFYPYSYSHVKAGTVPDQLDDDVYAVHLWDHTRRVMERSR